MRIRIKAPVLKIGVLGDFGVGMVLIKVLSAQMGLNHKAKVSAADNEPSTSSAI
jgi:hypothetical protein